MGKGAGLLIDFPRRLGNTKGTRGNEGWGGGGGGEAREFSGPPLTAQAFCSLNLTAFFRLVRRQYCRAYKILNGHPLVCISAFRNRDSDSVFATKQVTEAVPNTVKTFGALHPLQRH